MLLLLFTKLSTMKSCRFRFELPEDKINSDVIPPPKEPMFDSRINFGQGKVATTILTEEGCHYPVIHEPYTHRLNNRIQSPASAPVRRHRKGDRPMHKTTMTIAKPPWDGDFMTTSNQVRYSI